MLSRDFVTPHLLATDAACAVAVFAVVAAFLAPRVAARMGVNLDYAHFRHALRIFAKIGGLDVVGAAFGCHTLPK